MNYKTQLNNQCNQPSYYSPDIGVSTLGQKRSIVWLADYEQGQCARYEKLKRTIHRPCAHSSLPHLKESSTHDTK
jgi:hypothetical protein